MKDENIRPKFDDWQNLVLSNLRDIKENQGKSDDKIDDLSIRMTRVEDGHTTNGQAIIKIDNKIEKHIEDHKNKKNIIVVSILSFFSGLGLIFFEKIKLFAGIVNEIF